MLKKDSIFFLIGFALFGVIFLLCQDALSDILNSWQQEEYSYAFFVPPLALLIGLHRLSNTPVVISSSWAGLFLIVPSMAFWMIGELSGIPNLPQYGFLGLFYGVFLLFFGWKVVRVVWPALIYLFFAIPLPQMLYLSLSAKMQLISSDVGAYLLQFLGVSLFQEGNIIDLGEHKLLIEEACNGLRYLFPLISFGYLFALLINDAFWKKAVVFLSVIPLAIGLNALRIAVIGLVAVHGGTQAAIELTHDIEGWVAFFVCVFLLYVETFLLIRIPPKGSFADNYFDLPKPPFFSSGIKTKRPAYVTFALLCCFLAAYIMGLFSPGIEKEQMRKDFSAFPLNIGTWHGRNAELDAKTIDILKASDTLNITYQDSENSRDIGLFAAYYKSQRSRQTFHSPSVCMPGGGWKILRSSTIKIGNDDRSFRVNRVVIEKGSIRQLVYYWFEQRGVAEPNFYVVKARIILDSIIKNRTDGAMVRLVTVINPDEGEKKADVRLQDFAHNIVQTMGLFIPDYSQQSQDIKQ